MKLIIGLGNPGRQYENTRHNVGFRVLDAFVTKIQNSENNDRSQRLPFKNEKKFNSEIIRLGDIIFCKPQTFMNGSGEAVSKIANFYKVDTNNIYVIHDDLDIMLGEFKIQKGVGPHLHYGIQSIDDSLGNKEYWRVRVGIENRITGEPTFVKTAQGKDYVLQKFDDNEGLILDKMINKMLAKLAEAIIK